jgi:spoIIIJ-associated protein
MAASSDAAASLQSLLERICEALALDATVTVDDDGERLVGTVDAEDVGLFIGHHGQTIEAVQHLAQRIAGDADGTRRRIVVDAAGYRARREQVLQRQAEEAAESALRTGRPVALDAMSSSERRIVHEFLRDRGGVETHSEGQEPDRHLVVSPLSGADS